MLLPSLGGTRRESKWAVVTFSKVDTSRHKNKNERKIQKKKTGAEKEMRDKGLCARIGNHEGEGTTVH